MKVTSPKMIRRWGMGFLVAFIGLLSFHDMATAAPLASVLKTHVYTLAHVIGNRSMDDYSSLMAAERYITKQFRSFGYTVTLQEYKVDGTPVRNIIAAHPNAADDDPIFVVGAHYDTYDNPGADDNASGVAVLLELARALRRAPNSKRLQFVAFVNEEDPYNETEEMGSFVYVENAVEEELDIVGALVFDMVGYYPPQIKYLWVAPNRASMTLAKKVARAFPKSAGLPMKILPPGSEGYDESDHWSFWQEGFAAVLVSGAGFDYNDNYHTDADTYEKLDYNTMANVVTGMQAVLKTVIKKAPAKVASKTSAKAGKNTSVITVLKSGAGSGTIISGTLKCETKCRALTIPFTGGAGLDLKALPDPGSYFTRWETAAGKPVNAKRITLQPGDTIIAVFKPKIK